MNVVHVIVNVSCNLCFLYVSCVRELHAYKSHCINVVLKHFFVNAQCVNQYNRPANQRTKECQEHIQMFFLTGYAIRRKKMRSFMELPLPCAMDQVLLSLAKNFQIVIMMWELQIDAAGVNVDGFAEMLRSHR